MQTMKKPFCRSLGDTLNPLESELFRLICCNETQQVKEFLQLHRHIIDFSKKNNRGYTFLEIAILSKNKAILATLLATRKCEPIDNALSLATQLKFHDGVNVFLKYMNSKKRVLTRRISSPAIDLTEVRKSPVVIETPHEDIGLVLTEDDDDEDDNIYEELVSDSMQIEIPIIDEKLPTIIEEERKSSSGSTNSARTLLRSNTVPDDRLILSASTPKDKSNDEKKIPLLERMQSTVSIAPVQIKNNVEILRKAAISEDCKMIEMLVQSGFFLKEPDSTITPGAMDSLSESVDRLETYRALCSASYIAIVDQDPIKAAFRRSEQLFNLSIQCPENRDELLELAKKSSKFAVELLSLCYSAEEVRQLMLMKTSTPSPFAELKFGRLLVAVHCKQKEFIAHPNCQHIVASLWLEDLFTQWNRWGVFRRTLHIFIQAFLMPFMCMITLINPKLSIAKSARVPLNRFLYAATSYCIFLALILILLLHPSNKESLWRFIIQCIAFIFIVAAWIKLIANDLPFKGKRFFTCFWSIYDVLMYSLFTFAFVCILFLQNFLPICRPLGNGFLAIGFILAVIRILQWFQLHPSLGPFIIAFARIICSLVKILIVFLILYCAFSISLYSLYRDSQNRVPEEVETGDTGNFRTYSGTIEALYWALYGHGESSYADMPKSSNHNITTGEYDNVTENIGLALWGFFHLSCVIVLLNMVIALMTIKYEHVTDHCDMEWKFTRTKFWMYYFEDCNQVPIPFNVFLFIQNFVLWICRKRSKDTGHLGRLPSRHTRQLDPQYVISQTDSQHFSVNMQLSTGADCNTYSVLMNKLIQRYFHKSDLQEK